MSGSKSPHVCKHCGCAVGLWVHGWKHHRNWRSPRASCGRKLTTADVTLRPDHDTYESDRARLLRHAYDK